MDGDGTANVIVGRDHRYLNAYGPDGSSLPGWPIQTYLDKNGDSNDYYTDIRVGYAHGAPIMADLESDGIMEYIVTGDVAGPGSIDAFNSGLLVLEPDGTRRAGWETAALGEGILANTDFPQQAPVVADLDNDGLLEIVVSTHDGWIRAYRANQTLLWTFDYTQGAALFASEPVIGDIDEDDELEIVFGTYVPLQINSDRDGPVGVWGLNADGTIIPGFPLPISTPGVRAAPTLVDLDSDGNLEILAATRTGQIFAWDMPSSAAVWLPWPTSRHDLRRGATNTPDFHLTKSADPLVAQQDKTSSFSIRIQATQPSSQTIHLTDTIPTGLAYVPGTLTASEGSVTDTTDSLQWSGVILNTPVVNITFRVTVTTETEKTIYNTAILNTGISGQRRKTGYIFANGYLTYLPLILK